MQHSSRSPARETSSLRALASVFSPCYNKRAAEVADMFRIVLITSHFPLRDIGSAANGAIAAKQTVTK